MKYEKSGIKMTKRKLDEYDPDALDGYGESLYANTYNERFTTMKQQTKGENSNEILLDKHFENNTRRMFNLLQDFFLLWGNEKYDDANILIQKRSEDWTEICKILNLVNNLTIPPSSITRTST